MVYILTAFLTTGAVNAIYGYACFGIFVVFILQVIRRRNVYLNALGGPSLWILMLFGFSYAAIGGDNTGHGLLQAIFYYFIVPVLVYLAGWVLVELDRTNSAEVLFRTLLSMTIGFVVHASLDYFINIGRVRWELTDFFTGQIRAATGLGCINTFAFSLIGYWLFVEKRLKVKISALVLSMPSLLFGLLLGTRTQFGILLATSALALLLITYENRSLTAVSKILAVLLVMGGTTVVLYHTDALQIRTLIESSTLFQRINDTSAVQQDSDQYRINAFFAGVAAISAYPFGGNPHHYYHNMWLDVSRIAGIIPFTGILLFTVGSMVSTMQIFLNRQYAVNQRYFLLLIYVGIYLNFFVEPIMEGFMDFFLAFVLITGMVDACKRYPPCPANR